MTGSDNQPSVADLLQQSVAAIGANKAQRTTPLIDKLVRQEDFPVWRDKLTRTLARYDLDRYIKTDWRIDRADVDDYLQAVVPGHQVWANIKGMGWRSEDINPKKTYDFIVQYFERGTATSLYDMMRELVTIRREAFDKMESFQ
ncbi:hypothetical protein C8A03DRAFT_18075, partial [Achaetomium macrosporum]